MKRNIYSIGSLEPPEVENVVEQLNQLSKQQGIMNKFSYRAINMVLVRRSASVN